jgi:hypothetical protein
MKNLLRILILVPVLLAAAGPSVLTSAASSTGWTLVGWNNLGMHCMDSDYSVFSILPPYNTIHAQLIDPSGQLVRNAAGIFITYEAVADPSGSINTTSRNKSNFWIYDGPIYGVSPPMDMGLAGSAMPGGGNVPQAMSYDASQDWWIAEGIPITPYDDTGKKNPYPMMRLVARDRSGALLAETRIVLPVSDEMSCTTCHASGSGDAAKPAAGWVYDKNPDRDYRLNILRKHDDRQGTNPVYKDALARAGYSPQGLYATATGGKPILCAKCHASNALPGTGIAGITALTHTIHSRHATVIDPRNGLTLDASTNRAACYSCHPGSTTRCLRGAMGSAVAPDGTLAMQCQSCHGPMSAVGAETRQGWLDEPSCQSCHTGTATHNNGQIRYTSARQNGGVRQAVDSTFATNPNVPGPGHSLYRFSYGHGGLACEACHGSTHAEYPASHVNDNLQSQALQGHAGPVAECATCHTTPPVTANGGPHGLHPLGQAWVNDHGDEAEGEGGDDKAATTACAACHGADYRGTVLSYAQGDRTLSTEFGTKVFWRGFRVSCYACHNGPDGEGAARNQAPQVSNATASTNAETSVPVALNAFDADGNALELRVVSQPAHGTAGLSGRTATYIPEAGFTGTDAFTFAAWDGSIDSNLGTVTVTVKGGNGGGPTPQPPQVTAVNRLDKPFRVKILGTNFHAAMQVTINGRAWDNVLRQNGSSITLRSGGPLQAMFPPNTYVPITLTNTDTGGSVTVAFNRTTGLWRIVP